MTGNPSITPARGTSAFLQLRLWHLASLVLFVAIAIVEVQHQGRNEKPLIALASAGLAGYVMIGWLGWHLARRFEARLGRLLLLALYMIAMAVLYLAGTLIYLSIEGAYLGLPLF